MLRRIFWPKRDKVTGTWRKLHNEESNDLYSSPNTIQEIKSRKRSWVKHVARVREMTGSYRVWVRKPEERDRLEDPGVDGG